MRNVLISAAIITGSFYSRKLNGKRNKKTTTKKPTDAVGRMGVATVEVKVADVRYLLTCVQEEEPTLLLAESAELRKLVLLNEDKVQPCLQDDAKGRVDSNVWYFDNEANNLEN